MVSTILHNDSHDEVHVNLSSGNLSIGTVPLGCSNISLGTVSLGSSNISTEVPSGFTVRDIPKGEYDLEDEYPNL